MNKGREILIFMFFFGGESLTLSGEEAFPLTNDNSVRNKVHAKC